MNKWLKILIGLILIIVPIALILGIPYCYSWGLAAWQLIKGGVVLFIIMIGLLMLILGISELKE